jgi:GNAT superfamily N-acetyltransferase
MITIRLVGSADAGSLGSLIDRYMKETFSRGWSGTTDALARDAETRFEALLAAEVDQLVGFAVWTPAYDLHHCMPGGDLIDLYVVPEHRGRGVAALLVAAAAERIQRRGGRYLSGMAVDGDTTRRLYGRLAMSFPGAACIVGGKAFRTLAGLAGGTAREIVRGLPPREWNWEP